MASLLGELQRRNVFRVAIAYVVVGWIVLQVAETLSPMLQLPDWTPSLALYIGIIGFPFALLFAWAFELTPEGLKRSGEVVPEDSVTHVTASHINRVITVLLIIALVILLVERQWNGRSALDDIGSTGADSTVPTTEAKPTKNSSQADDTGAAPRSIAVLPFVNMSADPEQEYFSDGISEELLNALARISELRVAARTSSFAFKGQNQDITEIGRQLKVATVLEGSVRKSGQRLRITAQLINVDDGYHLWSDTYDRDLTDIFAIQDEISAAIVAALRVHLTDAPRERQQVNLEAYNLMLQARENVRSRNRDALQLAQLQFQKAIDLQPDYAQAWAGKALATYLLSTDNYGDIPGTEMALQAQAMIDRALALDPDLGLAHAAQALVTMESNRYREAVASLERAIATNPSEGILYTWLANGLNELGENRRRMQILEKAYRIDPLHPVIRYNLAIAHVFNGHTDRALAMTTAGTALHYIVRSFDASINGRYAEAHGELSSATEAPGATLGNAEFFKEFLTVIQLAEPLQPREGRQASFERLMQLVFDVEAACASLDRNTIDTSDGNDLTALVYCLTATQQWPQLLETLAPMKFETVELYGDITLPGDGVWLAWHQALALRELGREETSRALIKRIIAFVDKAATDGKSGYRDHLLARCHLVLGDHDRAMQHLQEGWSNWDIGWLELHNPWWRVLAEREDFQQLQAAIHSHTNNERAKLDWPPSTFGVSP